MFSRIFIERPIFASVISITIVLLGVVSIGKLPIARYPQIAPPTINVEAVYPGANATTIAETVAAPIEEQVNGVENMLYMTSTSSDDGTMNLSIVFEIGTDLDMANVLVQNRVAAAEPGLPEDVKRQGIETKKKSSETTLFIAQLFEPILYAISGWVWYDPDNDVSWVSSPISVGRLVSALLLMDLEVASVQGWRQCRGWWQG